MRKVLLFFCAAGLALAQVPSMPSAVPLPWGKPQFFTDNGLPAAGYKLCTYAAGTTTPLATYTDSTAGTSNANPVILDATGRASVWIQGQAYKFVLMTPGTDNTCSTGSAVWTYDNVVDTTFFYIQHLKFVSDSSLLSFKPLVGGSVPTGAVNRTIQQAISGELNVMSFGCVGDGVADDTACLQAAIDALPASGGAVYVPNGIYRFTATINVDKRVYLHGNGLLEDPTYLSASSSVLLKDCACTGLYITGGASTIERFIVNGKAGNTGYGIQVSSPKTALRDVAVMNQGGSGIRIGNNATSGFNCNLWTLDNVTSRANGGSGVEIYDNTSSGIAANANAGQSSSLFLYGNAVDGLTVGSTTFGGANVNNWGGIDAEANTRYGIYVVGPYAQNNVFWNPHAEANSGGHDIYFESGTVNNTIVTGDNHAVVDGGTNTLVAMGRGGSGQFTWYNHPIVISPSDPPSGNRPQLDVRVGLEGANPAVYFYQTTGSANNRLWTFIDTGVTFQIRATSDDLGTEASAISFIRNNASSVEVNMPGAVSSGSTYTLPTGYIVDTTAGNARSLYFRTSSVNRWIVSADNTAESGLNAGSNFLISRYNDAGVYQDSPLQINRATGNVGINVSPTTKFGVAGLPQYANEAAAVAAGLAVGSFYQNSGTVMVVY